MTYGSETRPLLVDVGLKFERAEMQMIRWMCGIDLSEDLMVDGETYECVKSFCYLGDTLDGDGGADLATARIRNGWMKFRELLPFLTSRAPHWR